MTNVPIRQPEPGETPLSPAEERVAQILRLRPKRIVQSHFAWRVRAIPLREPLR